MNKTEKQIYLYSALFISIVLNCGRLLALRENSIASRYWHFNTAEFFFQCSAMFIFCCLLFFLNLQDGWLSRLRNRKKMTGYIGLNSLIFICYMISSGIIQRRVFDNAQIRNVYWAAYLSKYLACIVLVSIITKIILLIREAGKRSMENEQLKNAYTAAELQLLKEQLNPHFLFNSLSSLSGIVRENPVLAQQYIKHLSHVFRHTLLHHANNLVSLEEELAMIGSFAELLKMRMENSFRLLIEVDKFYYTRLLPHLSIQPLLENAAKHNIATPSSPLLVNIYIEDEQLVVSNNFQPAEISGTGTGLANLNERFRILVQQEIDIEQTIDLFKVKLPLKHD